MDAIGVQGNTALASVLVNPNSLSHLTDSDETGVSCSESLSLSTHPWQRRCEDRQVRQVRVRVEITVGQQVIFILGTPAQKSGSRVAQVQAFKEKTSTRSPFRQPAGLLLLRPQGGYCQIMRLLLEHGADVMARDNEYSTSLRLAAFEGRVCAMRPLLKHGSKVHVQNNKETWRDAIPGCLGKRTSGLRRCWWTMFTL
jgi:hypothetical protein